MRVDGWRIVTNPPVRFRRPPGMLPLPLPAAGGSVDTLKEYVNVSSRSDMVLLVSWLLAALRDRGPYPVLVLHGEQGSAKSTVCAILRMLLDPNAAPLRALPREDRDLFIAANNGHVLAFDNVSRLPPWIADTLCRLATGGGFAARALFTDDEERLFDSMRPTILNGIENVVTRPDLADRSIFLTLDPIPEERRRADAKLKAAFEADRPAILGALLNAVARGLAELPSTQLDRLPRMADFALWASACEPGLWKPGTFGAAYTNNRTEAVDDAIDADTVAAAVRAFMESRARWEGTMSDLLKALGELAGEVTRNSKGWPRSAQGLRGRLTRAATFLRRVGIALDSNPRTRRERSIIIARTETAETISKPLSPSSPGEKTRVNTALFGDKLGDKLGDKPEPSLSPGGPSLSPFAGVRHQKRSVFKGGDKGDKGDEQIPYSSGGAVGFEEVDV